MIRYVTKRLIQAAVTLWAIVTLVFLFMRLLPVEGYFPEYDRMDETQIQAALTSMGLDAPIGVQLGRFYGSLLRGDLGESLIYRPHVKVAQIIAGCFQIAHAVAALVQQRLQATEVFKVQMTYGKGRFHCSVSAATSLFGQ